MKAAVHTKYGPPEVVRVQNLPDPVPGASDVLVKVYATTVNRTDDATRSATPFFARLITGIRKPRATVLGCEFAGEVEAVGRDVAWFDAGERIFGYVEGPFGGHAEYLVVPQNGSVAKVPDGIGYAQAAAATEGAHYALGLVRAAGIEAGSTVLVNGGSGAIGSAAVQLAKVAGAEVTAVCPGHLVDRIAALGADRCIDYTTEDFTNDDRRYDVIIDAVGKTTFGRCKHLLKRNGCFMSADLGPWAQNALLAIFARFRRGKRVLFPLPHHDRKMVEYLASLLEAGTFTPMIDRHFDLDDIVDAYRYVATGQKIGNVIIDVAHATEDAA